jgi:hypothetical protein
MFKYVYKNKDNQILNINGFKRLNGGRELTKSQLRLLKLKKIKLTSEQASNGFIKTMCEGLKNR